VCIECIFKNHEFIVNRNGERVDIKDASFESALDVTDGALKTFRRYDNYVSNSLNDYLNGLLK
jgi:hypothetical protein